MNKFESLLKEGGLHSIGNVNEIIGLIKSQKDFDLLFQELFNSDEKVVMRTADAIEKLTRIASEFLQKHKSEVLAFCQTATNIQFKWHLALLVSRIDFNTDELGRVWHILTNWATNRKESRIVRVNSIQGLFNLLAKNPELKQDFNLTIADVENENIPSLKARIKKIKRIGR